MGELSNTDIINQTSLIESLTASFLKPYILPITL